jgi:integrase
MGVKVREKKKGSGEWWVFINYRNRRKAVKIGPKKKAMARARELEDRIIRGEWETPPGARETFQEFAERWYKGHVQVMLKIGTRMAYGALLKNLYADFGNKPIGDITRADVREFCLSKIQEGLAPATVGMMKSVLCAILNVAVEDELIDRNPAARAGKFIPKAEQSRPFLSPEAAQALLGTARETDPEFHPVFLMMLRAGLRIGEVRALEWGDIDLAEKSLTVRKTNYRGHIGTPKGGRERTIPISDELESVLRVHRAKRAEVVLKSGRKWVFADDSGKPIEDKKVNSRLAKCLAVAGLPRMTSHSLRHSFGSHLLDIGASVPFTRDALGHRELTTTNRYSHSIAPSREVFNRLDVIGKSKASATPRNQEDPGKENTK